MRKFILSLLIYIWPMGLANHYIMHKPNDKIFTLIYCMSFISWLVYAIWSVKNKHSHKYWLSPLFITLSIWLIFTSKNWLVSTFLLIITTLHTFYEFGGNKNG